MKAIGTASGVLLLLASQFVVKGYNLAVTIDEPANNAWFAYHGIPYFDGAMTVDSTAEMFDIGATITCRIRRDADGYYWNGSSWGTDAVDLSTDVNGFSQGGGRPWQCTAALPSGSAVFAGGYTLTAHASQGLSSADTSCHVNLDFTGPVLTLSSPVDGSASTGFPFIGGTVVDPQGQDVTGSPAPASGVARVAVTLQRLSDYAIWDGANWNPSGDYVYAYVDNNGSWGLSMPPAAVSADDHYWLSISCCDRAGNCTQYPAINASFIVDTQAPVPPSFTFPASGGTVAGLPSISGTASDNAGGSGINRVLVSLQRLSDNAFWDGSGWTTETYFQATFRFVPTPIGFAPRVGWSVDGSWPRASALPDGSYRARAYAYDTAGNSAVATNTFAVNKQNPTIAFTSPANGSAVSSFPAIYGSATAPPGLSIARVDLYIYKPDWLAYWDGTIWDDQNTTVFHTTLTGPTTWYYEGTLPSGTDAPDDTYSLIAYAYDNANNSSPLVIYFSIDSTNPPPPTIDWPVNGAAVSSLPLIRGTGTDNPGGSGFQGAILFLSRLSDGKYWNGSAWDVFTFASILGANRSDTNWVRNFGLPAGPNLAEGAYSIVARSEDWASNLSDTRSNYFTVDLTPPLVSWVSPRDTAPVTTLPLLQGTASDPGGSGIQRVDVSLRRVGDGYYWDGDTWTAQLATLTTIVQGSTWSRSAGLPSGNDLAEGQYALQATAFDAAGNSSVTQRTAVVKKWPPGCLGSTANFPQTNSQPILDFQTTTSTIAVSGLDHYLWDVDATTFVTHTWNGDLIITLTSPAGTSTTLSWREGYSYDDVFNGTVWDDQGAVPVSQAVFVDKVAQPRLIPEGAMGAFIGQDPNGTWTLTVSDNAAGDQGELHSWALALTTLPTTPAAGTHSFGVGTALALAPSSTNSSSLVVTNAGSSLSHLVLQTFISDPTNSDLVLTLTSPAGTTTTISSHNGGTNSGVFFGTVWDDQAGLPVTLAAFTNGTTRTPLIPVGALAGFNGEDPNGQWTLTVANTGAGNSGTVNAWSLEVTTCACPPTLLATPSGNVLTLAWPTNATGFILESTPSLSPTSWTLVGQQQQIVNGFYTVTVGPLPGNYFFRLRQ
jgi:subtilisin-like proprotein convertase family protein